MANVRDSRARALENAHEIKMHERRITELEEQMKALGVSGNFTLEEQGKYVVTPIEREIPQGHVKLPDGKVIPVQQQNTPVARPVPAPAPASPPVPAPTPPSPPVPAAKPAKPKK